MNKQTGFTLIEIILVIGCLTLCIMAMDSLNIQQNNKIADNQKSQSNEIVNNAPLTVYVNNSEDNKPQITKVKNIDVNANPYNEKK